MFCGSHSLVLAYELKLVGCVWSEGTCAWHHRHSRQSWHGTGEVGGERLVECVLAHSVNMGGGGGGGGRVCVC